MIDSHAHLFFDAFDTDRDQVLVRAREAGVTAIINVGIDAPTSQAAVDLALRHEELHATAGLHPTSRVQDRNAELESLDRLIRTHRHAIVALGEIGLDYYWKDVPAEEQRPRLLAQLALAVEFDLPVVIHCRDAMADLLACLESASALPTGVFHCFAGGTGDARRVLDLGFQISFAGNVTYPKAVELQTVAREVPPERLLLETDSPFLPPQPRRGRRNEPAFARYTLEFLAGLHDLSVEDLERLTTGNTQRLFDLNTDCSTGV
jgi:TatD DNase family protein